MQFQQTKIQDSGFGWASPWPVDARLPSVFRSDSATQKISAPKSFVPQEELCTFLRNTTVDLERAGLPIKLLQRGEKIILISTHNFEINDSITKSEFLKLIGIADRVVEFRRSAGLLTAGNSLLHRELNDEFIDLGVALADYIVRQTIKKLDDGLEQPEDFNYRYGPGQYLTLNDLMHGTGVLFLKDKPIHLGQLKQLVFRRLQDMQSSLSDFRETVRFSTDDLRLDPLAVQVSKMSVSFFSTLVAAPLKPVVFLLLLSQVAVSYYRIRCLEKLHSLGDHSGVRDYYLTGLRSLIMPFSQEQLSDMASCVDRQAEQSQANLVYASCEDPLGTCLIGVLKDRHGWQCAN